MRSLNSPGVNRLVDLRDVNPVGIADLDVPTYDLASKTFKMFPSGGGSSPSVSLASIIAPGPLQIPLDMVATNTVDGAKTELVGTSAGPVLNALTGKVVALAVAGTNALSLSPTVLSTSAAMKFTTDQTLDTAAYEVLRISNPYTSGDALAFGVPTGAEFLFQLNGTGSNIWRMNSSRNQTRKIEFGPAGDQTAESKPCIWNNGSVGTGLELGLSALTNITLYIGGVQVAQFTSAGLAGSPANTVIPFTIDGSGVALTTGVKGDYYCEFAGTIIGVALLADQSGSVVVDIWKQVFGSYPPTVAQTIVASAPPTISTATNSRDTTLTGWTKTFAVGDTLRFNVNSCTTITRVCGFLLVTKS